MNEILVIGHKNPDTDAICSAIGYAEFKRRTGTPEAVAARCGEVNDRIHFVLRTFGVAAPKLVTDVSPKVRDVMQAEVFSVTPEATAAKALRIMDEHDVRILPVLDEERRCHGLLSLFKLSKFLFPTSFRLVDSRRVLSSLENLARTLEGKLLFAHEARDEKDLILMIGAMGFESFSHRLKEYPRRRLAVVVGDRSDIQALAIQEGVCVLIVTGGLPIEEKLLAAARERNVSVISSPNDTATTAALCRASVVVSHMTNKLFLSLPEDATLASVRAKAAASGYAAFPVVDPENRTVGIVSKTDFLKAVQRRLILVDHNELSQAVQGADQAEILEIIDHHRIGALTTQQPILFRNEPVGSTSTIVADCFLRQNVELPPPIAGLLLAGVVSDTLNLTSPTTTPRDQQILRELEKISKINAREFTDKLFATGSLLTLKPAPQAIMMDCKEYQEGDVTFSVAQIEEVGFDQFWKRKDDLLIALKDYRREHDYLFSALLITDVTTQSSLLLVTSEKKFKDRITYPELEPGIFEMRDVVSRKKQLLPYLTDCLQRMYSEA
ncbi:MAG TPA: putative manganese-dependent inorganic diphosphatase [Verrucomicrobiae bacterium]|jgi:manganese-dependent inorganic pyrophosphatase|nr:putative manganese-dependent inorganic diphosphatase [Verrucomicrobiae bacterium]